MTKEEIEKGNPYLEYFKRDRLLSDVYSSMCSAFTGAARAIASRGTNGEIVTDLRRELTWLDYAVKKLEPDHKHDSQCFLDPDQTRSVDHRVCLICDTIHGEPCGDCGGRGFHDVGCPFYRL